MILYEYKILENSVLGQREAVRKNTGKKKELFQCPDIMWAFFFPFFLLWKLSLMLYKMQWDACVLNNKLSMESGNQSCL